MEDNISLDELLTTKNMAIAARRLGIYFATKTPELGLFRTKVADYSHQDLAQIETYSSSESLERLYQAIPAVLETQDELIELLRKYFPQGESSDDI